MAAPSSPTDLAGTTTTDAYDAADAIRTPVGELGPRARRTVARIVEAARGVFLTRGYAGATVDEIARLADVSRASVYTYFPSKREILFAVGARGAEESVAVIATLPDRPRTRAGMAAFVTDYFGFLDQHGSFSFAWSEAAQADEEIRVAGMRRHLAICRTFGEILAASGRRTSDGPEMLGMMAWSLLERGWHYVRLYDGTIDRDQAVDAVAASLFAMARSLP